jgi:hypothetical protein
MKTATKTEKTEETKAEKTLAPVTAEAPATAPAISESEMAIIRAIRRAQSEAGRYKMHLEVSAGKGVKDDPSALSIRGSGTVTGLTAEQIKRGKAALAIVSALQTIRRNLASV